MLHRHRRPRHGVVHYPQPQALATLWWVLVLEPSIALASVGVAFFSSRPDFLGHRRVFAPSCTALRFCCGLRLGLSWLCLAHVRILALPSPNTRKARALGPQVPHSASAPIGCFAQFGNAGQLRTLSRIGTLPTCIRNRVWSMSSFTTSSTQGLVYTLQSPEARWPAEARLAAASGSRFGGLLWRKSHCLAHSPKRHGG